MRLIVQVAGKEFDIAFPARAAGRAASRATSGKDLARTDAGQVRFISKIQRGERLSNLKTPLSCSVESDADGCVVYCEEINVAGAGDTIERALASFQKEAWLVFSALRSTPKKKLAPDALAVLEACKLHGF